MVFVNCARAICTFIEWSAVTNGRDSLIGECGLRRPVRIILLKFAERMGCFASGSSIFRSRGKIWRENLGKNVCEELTSNFRKS